MKITLIKFGAPWCSACHHMDKARTLEQFAATTGVTLVKHDLKANDDGDEQPDPIADEYEVQSLPTLVFEDEDGNQLERIEGGISLRDLRKKFDAIRAAEPSKRKTKSNGHEISYSALVAEFEKNPPNLDEYK